MTIQRNWQHWVHKTMKNTTYLIYLIWRLSNHLFSRTIRTYILLFNFSYYFIYSIFFVYCYNILPYIHWQWFFNCFCKNLLEKNVNKKKIHTWYEIWYTLIEIACNWFFLFFVAHLQEFLYNHGHYCA